MDISIIVPAYNVEHYVQRCIDSIVSQIYVKGISYEVIIVNDGSTDTTLQVVQRIEKENKNVKVLSQPNQGLSMARNNGLNEASGEYVWFVDSDDWISQMSLHKIWMEVKSSTPDVILIRAANSLDGKLLERGKPFVDAGTPCTGKGVLLKRIWSTCAPFYIFRKDFLQKNCLKFYHGIFHEDNEFTPRMLYKAERVSLLNDVLYFVFQNPNSITRTINHKKSFDLLKVADSLVRFCRQEVREKDIERCFLQFISLNINNALWGTSFMPKDVVKTFEAEMKKHHEYANILIRSNVGKYMVEGFLFRLSSQYVGTYRFLQKFNL